MNYPIVIYPDDGGYVAKVPAWKECLAQGETLAETLEELQTVAALWIETPKSAGGSFPMLLISQLQR